MTFIHQKKFQSRSLFRSRIDDVTISFKGTFDKINDLLKASTDIGNNNKKSPIWKEQLRVHQQTVVEFALANYRKKLLTEFTEQSYFLYDKSNLIKESFITNLNNTTKCNFIVLSLVNEIS